VFFDQWPRNIAHVERHADIAIAFVGLSVCLSVCLSHAGIMLIRLNRSSNSLGKRRLYSALYCVQYSSLNRSGMARVNDGSHSFTCHPDVYPQVEWTIPAFTPQSQSVTALWLVLISRPDERRRLSWPGWLGEIPRSCTRPKTVIHPSSSRGGRESNSRPSSRKSNALTTRLYQAV